MLTYRHFVLLILLASTVILLAGIGFGFLTTWWALLLIILNLIALAGGSFYVCSGLYLRVHCLGNTTKKQLVISFDDGPHPEYTPLALDILKKHDIKALFFLVGENAEKNEALVRRIISEGHIIGNHSYKHSNNYGFRNVKALVGDMSRANKVIETITGKEMNLFRPPFGVTNPNIARAVSIMGCEVIGWSIRSLDTLGRPPEETIKRVARQLKPGGVILLHDTHIHIARILAGVIEKAKQDGYEFVQPDVMFNLKTYRS